MDSKKLSKLEILKISDRKNCKQDDKKAKKQDIKDYSIDSNTQANIKL